MACGCLDSAYTLSCVGFYTLTSPQLHPRLFLFAKNVFQKITSEIFKLFHRQMFTFLARLAVWLNVDWSFHHFGPDWNISAETTGILPWTDIHGPQRMNPIDGGGLLTTSNTMVRLTFVVLSEMSWQLLGCHVIWFRHSLNWWSLNFSSRSTSRSKFQIVQYFYEEIPKKS